MRYLMAGVVRVQQREDLIEAGGVQMAFDDHGAHAPDPRAALGEQLQFGALDVAFENVSRVAVSGSPAWQTTSAASLWPEPSGACTNPANTVRSSEASATASR
jgi:hypothetical protein